MGTYIIIKINDNYRIVKCFINNGETIAMNTIRVIYEEAMVYRKLNNIYINIHDIKSIDIYGFILTSDIDEFINNIITYNEIHQRLYRINEVEQLSFNNKNQLDDKSNCYILYNNKFNNGAVLSSIQYNMLSLSYVPEIELITGTYISDDAMKNIHKIISSATIPKDNIKQYIIDYELAHKPTYASVKEYINIKYIYSGDHTLCISYKQLLNEVYKGMYVSHDNIATVRRVLPIILDNMNFVKKRKRSGIYWCNIGHRLLNK